MIVGFDSPVLIHNFLQNGVIIGQTNLFQKKPAKLIWRLSACNSGIKLPLYPPHPTALQRHYGILEALALGEDEMPDIKDETLPDEEGLAR